MEGRYSLTSRLLVSLALALAILPAFGCVGITAQFMNVFGIGTKVKPEYPGLEKKKVAVVCVSDSTGFGPDVVTESIAFVVQENLRKHVKGIEVVPRAKVNEQIDGNWSDYDYPKLGRSLGVDKVVAIEVMSYGLYEGQTLYKGQTEYVTMVYDVATNTQEFRRGPVKFESPKSGAPIAEYTEREFETRYLQRLGYRVARVFFPYEANEDVATDSMID